MGKKEAVTVVCRNAGINSAENLRDAFQALTERFVKELGEECVRADIKHYTVTLKMNGKEKVIALKRGCSVLGYKGTANDWEIMPGVDAVLYAVSIDPATVPEEQLRYIEKEAFIEMWESLELVRRKMSGTALRKFKLIYGNSVKPDSRIYADTIGVQSFNNSGRKSFLVAQYLERFPLLSEINISDI